MSLYRMYVDEVGNHDLKSADNPNERFLSLSGVIIESTHYRDVISKEMEELKRRHFTNDPDEPVILHRSEIVNKKKIFSALKDKKKCMRFDADILTALERWDYKVVAVVIDKLQHREQYGTWQFDAYHYCLWVLLERYVMYLQNFFTRARGDVLAESRGGKEDIRLKRTYENAYNHGTDFIEKATIQRYLTSGELKVKPKSANIAGLQLADLIAHPSRRYILKKYNLVEDSTEVFGDKVGAILEANKFRRGASGKIEGFGIKMLP